MTAISSNHFSHDQQLADAANWLVINRHDLFDAFLVEFPEWRHLQWGDHGSWIDHEAMGVDVEWSSWATDWVESHTPIYWEEGEPWIDEDT